jgi:hypothetical protein
MQADVLGFSAALGLRWPDGVKYLASIENRIKYPAEMGQIIRAEAANLADESYAGDEDTMIALAKLRVSTLRQRGSHTSARVAGMKLSIRSGTLRTIRRAQRTACSGFSNLITLDRIPSCECKSLLT